MYSEIKNAKTGETCEIRPVDNGPSMHDIIGRMKEVSDVIRGHSRSIQENLFGSSDISEQRAREVCCAQDALVDILRELEATCMTLDYVVNRL